MQNNKQTAKDARLEAKQKEKKGKWKAERITIYGTEAEEV
jgi:hypothetical protein